MASSGTGILRRVRVEDFSLVRLVANESTREQEHFGSRSIPWLAA
jgi:hypothetical protein